MPQLGRAGSRLAAQIPLRKEADCGAVQKAIAVCYFPTQAVAGNTASPGTIVIAITEPAGVTMRDAYAAACAGSICATSASAGTTVVTLACPSGLRANATASVTFEPAKMYQSVSAAVTYDGDQMGGAGSEAATESLGLHYPPALMPSAPAEPPRGPAPAYPAGWNFVGGRPGWNPYAGPLAGSWHQEPIYTYLADDADDEAAPDDIPFLGGVGFWVYFASPTLLPFEPVGRSSLTIMLPQGHSILIANPANTESAVEGADLVYAYDPGTATYAQTNTLQIGQGAWAYSAACGAVTVSALCQERPCQQPEAPELERHRQPIRQSQCQLKTSPSSSRTILVWHGREGDTQATDLLE